MPFLVTTIWIVFSLDFLYPMKWRKVPVGIVIIIVFIISFIYKIPDTIQKMDPKDQYYPAEYAEYLLPQLPQDAILLTSSDPDSFPIWYYHFGLGWRSDIRVIVLPLTQFSWYQETLPHTYPDLMYPPVINQISNNSQVWGESIPNYNTGRPICKTSIERDTKNTITATCSTGESFIYTLSE